MIMGFFYWNQKIYSLGQITYLCLENCFLKFLSLFTYKSKANFSRNLFHIFYISIFISVSVYLFYTNQYLYFFQSFFLPKVFGLLYINTHVIQYPSKNRATQETLLIECLTCLKTKARVR